MAKNLVRTAVRLISTRPNLIRRDARVVERLPGQVFGLGRWLSGLVC